MQIRVSQPRSPLRLLDNGKEVKMQVNDSSEQSNSKSEIVEEIEVEISDSSSNLKLNQYINMPTKTFHVPDTNNTARLRPSHEKWLGDSFMKTQQFDHQKDSTEKNLEKIK